MTSIEIINKVAAMSQEIGGEYELTHRSVPIIIIQFECQNRPHSFCWMAKRKKWRGFYPYQRKGEGWTERRDMKQVKKDFRTDEELIAFVKTKRATIKAERLNDG